MEAKKRVTKLTLEDIPKIDSPFRSMLINKLTEKETYKKALEKNAVLGFSSWELNAIEERYKTQGGMLNEDIRNEINKKGWLIKPTTIKQYIQKDLLPMPKERRKVPGKGAVSLYPLNFMRHLNFVRFMLNIGRDICMNILYETPSSQHFSKISDYSFLQSIYHKEEIYDGDDRLEPFLYDSYGEMFFDMADLDRLIDAGLNWNIEMFKTAEAVLNGDENFKNNNEFEHCLKLFNVMKAKSGYSENLDKARMRVQKYTKELIEIKHTLEAASKRLKSLVEETKKAMWT